MKIKTYKTISTHEMYEEYKEALDKEKYINEFIEKEKDKGIVSREDFLSLLLSSAVKAKDEELIKNILVNNDKNTYPSLLTNIDELRMSPLSYTLLLDDEGKIKPVLKAFLNQGYYFQRVVLTKEAFVKLKDTVGYQGESYIECVDDLIKPICIEEQVNALGDPAISVDSLLFN